MGGGFVECEGDDVIKELNAVFSHPGTKAYAAAQSQKDLFEGIGVGVDNWQDLVAAYKAAGVPVSLNWQAYLKTLSPEKINQIAQARFDGLTRGVAMKTKKHKPNQGGHGVKVTDEADGSIMIDSPFPA